MARNALGRTGWIVAVDPRPIEPIDGVEVLRGRVGDARTLERLGNEPFDVILSDMSPAISGAYATDHARSVALVRAAFDLAPPLLREKGVFVAKVFTGDLLEELEAELRPQFRRLVRSKPPASREHSSEMYLLGLGYRRPAEPAP